MMMRKDKRHSESVRCSFTRERFVCKTAHSTVFLPYEGKQHRTNNKPHGPELGPGYTQKKLKRQQAQVSTLI